MSANSAARPRILVTEPEYFTPDSLREMSRVGKVIARRMTRAELLREIKNTDAIVVRIDTRLDAELIKRATRLKCVVSATTGLNHIDTKSLEKRKISLFSLHGAHSVPTAEHALTLLLASGRRILAANKQMQSGGWDRWKYIGTEFEGKTLGIFGIGRIGTQLSMRARGLGMQVIAYDPYVSAGRVKKRGGRKVDWKTFLKTSDFFSLHAPLTAETRDRFGAKELRAMKPSAILINTARGEILDGNALITALEKKTIRAAAVDVYPEEPLSSGSPLRTFARKHDNLILTPHIAASTEEAVRRASAFSALTLIKFFRKR